MTKSKYLAAAMTMMIPAMLAGGGSSAFMSGGPSVRIRGGTGSYKGNTYGGTANSTKKSKRKQKSASRKKNR